MPVMSSSTTCETVPEAREWGSQIGAAIKEIFPDESVHIAATDRGSSRQNDTVSLLLGQENVIIEWVNAENVDEICEGIQNGKIDGIILTAWEDQDPEIASKLDRDLLVQNRKATRPVPLFAIAEGMVELLRSIGGSTNGMPSWASTDQAHPVEFAPDSYLHRWADLDRMWVTADRLPDLIPPEDGVVVVNVTSHHTKEWIVEGFEGLYGALHVGTRFDPVELFLLAPTDDTSVWSLTPTGAESIIKGFVNEVRNPTTN